MSREDLDLVPMDEIVAAIERRTTSYLILINQEPTNDDGRIVTQVSCFHPNGLSGMMDILGDAHRGVRMAMSLTEDQQEE